MRFPFLKNPAAQKAFEEKGYVALPFLNEAEVAALLKLYDQHVPADVTGLHISIGVNDYATNRVISDAVRAIVTPACERTCIDYTLFAESFMVKSNKGAKQLKLHQDWTNVDETQDQSAVMWCALMDIKIENGAMFYIDGSHQYFKSYRSGVFPASEIEADPVFEPFLTPVELKAGEVLFFQPTVFHGSFDNLADQPRKVLFGCIASKHSDLVYYYKGKQTATADVYTIDKDIFLSESVSLGMGEMPKLGKYTKTIPYTHQIFTKNELLQKIYDHHPKAEGLPPLTTETMETAVGSPSIFATQTQHVKTVATANKKPVSSLGQKLKVWIGGLMKS